MIMTSNNTPLPPPGRELDRLVAERIGLKYIPATKGGWPEHVEFPDKPGQFVELLDYSTNIAAAWQVIKYLDDKREDRDFSIELLHQEWEPFNWQCDFRYDGARIAHVALAVGVSEAHAICLAFLAIPELV
jgi:hypothetical protein